MKWLFPILIFGGLTLLAACIIQSEKNKAKRFAKEFKMNQDDYILIQNFLSTNGEDINTIRLESDSILFITKIGNKNAMGDYILIEDVDLNSKSKGIINAIKVVMLKHDILYAGKIRNEILFSYKYSGTPCLELYWKENKELNEKVNEVGVYEEASDEVKTLQINKNWFLKKTPCFN